VGSTEEEDLDGDSSEREPMKEENPDEDPEEDPSRGEPIEEEDPEEDPKENFKVSEGQLIGSEDLEVDSSERETEHIEKENPDGDQEGGREFTGQDDQTREPESLGKEIDSMEKRGTFETGMTR